MVESPSGAEYPIVDAAGNLWSIRRGSVAKNGRVDNRTSHVTGLLYWLKTIYETDGIDWRKLTSLGWVVGPDPRENQTVSGDARLTLSANLFATAVPGKANMLAGSARLPLSASVWVAAVLPMMGHDVFSQEFSLEYD